MIENIEIQIGDQVFVAEMLNKKAPKTCEAIKSILPLDSITWHQFWSGQGLQCHDMRLKQMARDHGMWPNAAGARLNVLEGYVSGLGIP